MELEWSSKKSSVPVPIHVGEAEEVDDFAPDFVETSVGLVVRSDHVSVGPVAEGSVGRVFAVTQLVVPALWDVEGDWSASGNIGVAGAVAAGIGLTESAGAPWVHFSSLEVGIVGEPTWVID